jgi:uncharacterized short protein YbdD (DUF466 family)
MILLTGISVSRVSGDASNVASYNLDVIEVSLSPDGNHLSGRFRDVAGSGGIVALRKISGSEAASLAAYFAGKVFLDSSQTQPVQVTEPRLEEKAAVPQDLSSSSGVQPPSVQSEEAAPPAVIEPPPTEVVPSTVEVAKPLPAFTTTPGTVIRELTERDLESSLFDIETVVLPVSLNEAVEATAAALRKTKEKEVQTDSYRSIVTTALTRHGMIGFPTYTRYVIVFRPTTPTSTEMTYRFLAYWMKVEDKSNGRRSMKTVLLPETNSRIMQKRRREFVDRVRKELPTI